ncbi:MAG: arginase [Halobacteria archaeon]|nr:arginase [Halobacteria archaeon]
MDRVVNVIGAPMDYGANRRGVDMGPSAIRYAGLAERIKSAGGESIDSGDILIPRPEELEDQDEEEEYDEGGSKAKHLEETANVCSRLSDEVSACLEEGMFPLVLGGDHSIAMGTLNGASQNTEIGAIWFDAHGDFNTPETTPSGNVHGMPLAGALGKGSFADTEWANAPGLREENVVMVGLRSLDDDERETIRESDVTSFTMTDIDERGISSVVDEALDIATHGVDSVHVSLDLDWLDPNEAPGVGTPVNGGVTYREAHLSLEMVAERHEEEGVLRSMELVEVNPILDEHNRTANLATELVASAFGKRIL